MPTVRNKPEIITFKADKSLLDAMKGIPNRSAFIRSAVLAALDSACPLCGGTGVLTPSQRERWFTGQIAQQLCEELAGVGLTAKQRSEIDRLCRRAGRRFLVSLEDEKNAPFKAQCRRQVLQDVLTDAQRATLAP